MQNKYTLTAGVTLIESQEKGDHLKWAPTLVQSLDGKPIEVKVIGPLEDTSMEAMQNAKNYLRNLVDELKAKQERLYRAAPKLASALHLLLKDAESGCADWHEDIDSPEHPWHRSIMGARAALAMLVDPKEEERTEPTVRPPPRRSRSSLPLRRKSC